jgi:DNA polymerase III sliding clamp (beta) subunit (PCNA family)
MTIKIAKSDFEAALKVVSNTVNLGANDITAHYVFRVREGKLTIFSYTSRIFSSCPVVASVDEDVQFTAEAWRVTNMLNAVPNNTVLALDYKQGEVRISTDRGKIEFSSLDPTGFPFWDDLLAVSKETARISAERLASAFAHAKMFVGTDEAKMPHLCVVEFRGGCLYSTDQTAVSCIKVQGMEASTVRIHGKDVNAVSNFLGTVESGEVAVLEHERASFFKRDDGAVFGETLFGHRFPDFTVDWEMEDDYTWELFKEEFGGNVRFLTSGAVKGDHKLTLNPIPGEKKISMTMSAVSGKPMSVDLATQKMEAKEGAAALPEGGFNISHPHVTLTFGDHSSNLIRVGVSKRKQGGWLRIQDNRGQDVYLTTIAWLKKPA